MVGWLVGWLDVSKEGIGWLVGWLVVCERRGVGLLVRVTLTLSLTINSVFINRAENHGFSVDDYQCRTFHGVGKPDFNGRRLIPDRFCVIIDRAPSIGPHRLIVACL